jgi:hypothetical protein
MCGKRGPLSMGFSTSTSNSSNPSRGDENTIREDEIYKWFTRKENVHIYSADPYGFVDRLIENARCYVNFAQGKDKHGNYNINLQHNQVGWKCV